MKTKVVYQLKLWILGIKYREKTKKKIFLKTYMHFLMVEKEFLMLLKGESFQ